LTKLMIDYDVGVTEVAIDAVKKGDLDYFEDEE
jgi:restriction endonuclease Mrr